MSLPLILSRSLSLSPHVFSVSLSTLFKNFPITWLFYWASNWLEVLLKNSSQAEHFEQRFNTKIRQIWLYNARENLALPLFVFDCFGAELDEIATTVEIGTNRFVILELTATATHHLLPTRVAYSHHLFVITDHEPAVPCQSWPMTPPLPSTLRAVALIRRSEPDSYHYILSLLCPPSLPTKFEFVQWALKLLSWKTKALNQFRDSTIRKSSILISYFQKLWLLNLSCYGPWMMKLTTLLNSGGSN